MDEEHFSYESSRKSPSSMPNQSTESESLNYLKFQLQQETDYIIFHHCPVTKGADLLLELNSEDGDPTKNWLIPVHKDFLMSKIPFFKIMLNTNGVWRETRNDNLLEGIQKIKITKPSYNVSKKTIVKFLQIIYARTVCTKEDNTLDCNFYLYDDLTCDNVFEFIELAEYWNVESFRKSAIKFFEERIDSSMIMRAFSYDDPFVRDTLKPICEKFIQSLATDAASFLREKHRLEYVSEKINDVVRDLDGKIQRCNFEHRKTKADLIKSAANIRYYVKKDLEKVLEGVDEPG